MRRALAGGLPVALLVALPGAAHACAVCGAAAADRSNAAFVNITILLSALPLAMIGAGVWWVARHAGAHLADELSEREVPAGVPGPPAGGGEA